MSTLAPEYVTRDMLDTAIASLRAELNQIRAELHQALHSQTWRLIGLQTGLLTLAVAIIKFA